MNNFPKPHDNLQHPKYIAPLISKETIRTPLVMQDFHKTNTSPLPAVPKVSYYSESWDPKVKRRPSLHQISETILSNRHYVIACSVFMSFIIIVMLLKLAIQVLLK